MTAGSSWGSDDIAIAGQLACLLEASAPKPGNVSPGLPFHDTRYEDFLASAAAIGPALLRAGERPLGTAIREASDATARWTRSNTNLGIVLLLVPLARAALAMPAGARDAAALRTAVRAVLDRTTVRDAEEVYAAIRVARPGGLGRVEVEDVSTRPTLPLVEVMRLAAPRDGIAREYATAFAATFEVGAPALATARGDGLSWGDAVVETYLALLAAAPDTHIVRKLGAAAAADVSARARDVIGAGGVRSVRGRAAVAALETVLRLDRNAWNPGTTADLTAAAIFVRLLAGEWDGDRSRPDRSVDRRGMTYSAQGDGNARTR